MRLPLALLVVLRGRSQYLRGRSRDPRVHPRRLIRHGHVFDVHRPALHDSAVRHRIVREPRSKAVRVHAPVAPDVDARGRGPRGGGHRRRHRPIADGVTIRRDVRFPIPAAGRRPRGAPPGAQPRRRRVHPRAEHLLAERRGPRRERRWFRSRPIPRVHIRIIREGITKRLQESKNTTSVNLIAHTEIKINSHLFPGGGREYTRLPGVHRGRRPLGPVRPRHPLRGVHLGGWFRGWFAI